MASTERNETAIWCRGCLGGVLTPVGEKDGFTFHRCADCRTVVVDPYPTTEELVAHYKGYGHTVSYLKKMDAKLRRARGRVRKMKKQGVPGNRFLDVGCNVGTVVAAARDAGFDPVGIDIDPDGIVRAQEIFGSKGRFEAISVEDMAKRGDAFDAVYMSEVVEHVNDPESFIAAVAALVAPGGLLYLTAPDGGHFGVPKNFADWGMVCPPEHLTFFSRKGVSLLLARHGLVVERFQIAFKPGLKAFARKKA